MRNCCAALLAMTCMTAAAQTVVTRSNALGVGRAHVLDTYLSPTEYSGTQMQYLHQSTRHSSTNASNTWQHMLQMDLSRTYNPSHRATMLGGDVRYDAGWHHWWSDVWLPGLQLKAGAQTGLNVGFLYADRNQNNPAQARASVHLAASVGGAYTLHIGRMPLRLSYQADLPVVGAMFSPHYGQSYYEIFSLGHTDHNVRATHPVNALWLRQQFGIDIPIRRQTLRLGYLSDLRNSHVNQLRTHQYSRAFTIGIVRTFHITHP